MTATSSTRKTNRESICASRKSLFRIGVATMSLRVFFRRALTIEKPTPQIPVPMRFRPRMPGIRKSM